MELCTPVSDLLVRGRFSGGVPLGDTSGAVCAASQSWLSGKRCSCLVTLVREIEGINLQFDGTHVHGAPPMCQLL